MLFENAIITPKLFDAVMAQYRLDKNGIHGIEHWQRVEAFAVRLAESAKMKSDVFSLFALFHDACRHHEDWDNLHGPRGAELAYQFNDIHFELPPFELKQLCEACEGHTQQTHHDDPVIRICWDADRLDLSRVGIQPDPKYHNTN